MPADERPLRPPSEVCPVKGPGHLTTAAMQVDTGKSTAPVVRQCESDAWTAAAAEELAGHEAAIERGLNTFIDVGLRLAAVRDKRLYPP